MTNLEALVFRNGARLVPYVSHSENELIRHRSFYAFAHVIISSDLKRKNSMNTTIAELGFGSGYGCSILSSLPNVKIVGIENNPACSEYAKQFYARNNVNYQTQDFINFFGMLDLYDYILTSRGLANEQTALEIVKNKGSNKRIILSISLVDANENSELATDISAKLKKYLTDENIELFYEDTDGNIFPFTQGTLRPVGLIIVISAPTLPIVESYFDFPIQTVLDDSLEFQCNDSLRESVKFYESPASLTNAIEELVVKTEVVLDIGCGIVPMNFFRPKLHLMVEPWNEYAEILKFRYFEDKSIIILREGALETLSIFGDKSVDSIFLLDVIEHLEKDVGGKVLKECERVARTQIVIFTPLGFMAQHVDANEKDGWGLSGQAVQEHKSGWHPADFDKNWSFHICRNYHSIDFKGEATKRVYGAFYAIRNIENETQEALKPETFSDIRRPLPSEIANLALIGENNNLRQYLTSVQNQLAESQARLNTILNNPLVIILRKVRIFFLNLKSKYR